VQKKIVVDHKNLLKYYNIPSANCVICTLHPTWVQSSIGETITIFVQSLFFLIIILQSLFINKIKFWVSLNIYCLILLINMSYGIVVGQKELYKYHYLRRKC